jgi:hypothetical protein
LEILAKDQVEQVAHEALAGKENILKLWVVRCEFWINLEFFLRILLKTLFAIAHRIHKPGFFLYFSFLSAKLVETGFLASQPAGWVRSANLSNQGKSQISNLKSQIVLMPRQIVNSFETLAFIRSHSSLSQARAGSLTFPLWQQL